MKTALITGAAKRIGKAIAERFLAEDYQLILHANTSFAELQQWVTAHEARHKVVRLIKADLATEAGQTALVAETSSCITALDLLVHNASQFSPMPFAQIDRHNLRVMMGINFEAPFFITQGLLPQLLAAPEPSVINLIDAMWQRPKPRFAHYAASKGALAILTRALANEYAPRLRVNAVAPGAMVPPEFQTAEQRAQVIARIPFQRFGDAKDIANAVYFLSEVAHYASGEIFVIDGGRSVAS